MSQVSQHLDDLLALEGRWSLDPGRTTIEFRTKLIRLVTVKGTIRAIEGRASVGTDGAIDGALVLDAATIDTGIKRRDAHLRSADFFDADRYPTMVFNVQSARRAPARHHEIEGSLTLHGQTQQLTILASIQHRPTDVVVSASDIDVTGTAWGVGRAGLGPSTKARVAVKARFVRE